MDGVFKMGFAGFTGFTIGQGFRFTVYDASYDDLVPVMDCGYDMLEATEDGANYLEIHQPLQDRTAHESQIPSGWVASADECESTSDKLEESARYTLGETEDDLDSLRHAGGLRCPGQQNSSGFHCVCDDDDLRECHTIHRLSQISRRFTNEFGECVWESAIVNFLDPELFFTFFENRPQILKHVKCLKLSFSYNVASNFNTSPVLLLKF